MDWSAGERVRTIAQIAMDRGRSAGAVASVMASHATPAAVIAHNVSRNNYAEIFNEMVSSDLDVIMGGGHPLYDPSGSAIEPSAERGYRYVGGSQTLGELTSEAGLNGFSFIDDKADFEALASGVFPALRRFEPQMLFISAGFDAHGSDPLAQLLVNERDFAWATQQLCLIAKELCSGRVVSTLEGGYDLHSLSKSVAAHVAALKDHGMFCGA